MPPASYIFWIVVVIGGALASLPLTMGVSIFVIIFALPIVSGLIVAVAAWRIVLASGAPAWPAVVVTVACASWLIALSGSLTGQTLLTRLASMIGSVSIIACGVASWRMQKILSDDRFGTPVYGYTLAAIGLLMVAGSNTLVTLPRFALVFSWHILSGLAVLGCVLIVWSIYQMVQSVGRERWIVISVLLPVGLFAAVLGSRYIPGMRMSMSDGVMFVIFPFLTFIGGMGFWRLSALVSNWISLRGIDALNAGRFAA